MIQGFPAKSNCGGCPAATGFHMRFAVIVLLSEIFQGRLEMPACKRE
jgi:hypothetical protein